MNVQVVHGADVLRMKRSVLPPPKTDFEAKRLELRERSEARIKKWPNTLQAVRAKKENWKRDKEEKEEEQRREIDRGEEGLQKRLRMESIRRANELLYEQTDKMKNLRSQQLYSDVLEDRALQLEEKRMMATWQRQRGEGFVKMMKEQLVAAEAKEIEQQKARQKHSLVIAAQQREQLEDYKNSYIDQLRAEKLEGERLKQKALEDLLEDQEKEAQRRRAARQAADDTTRANSHLKILKAEMQREEDLEEERRKEEADKKEKLIAARKSQETLRFQEKQMIKQRMIDKASKQLEILKSKTDAREERQAVELKKKEDEETRRRDERRARQQAAIERSRAMQLKMRADKREAEKRGNAVLAQHWRERNVAVEAEERQEAQAARQCNIDIRMAQEEQMEEKRTKTMEERALRMYAEEQTKAVMQEDEMRFRKYAEAELDKTRSLSTTKNVLPIQKAMLAKDITVIPAGGTRV